MSQEKYDIFISYSRKDTAIADQICAALDSVGITYFIDRQGIGIGDKFVQIIVDKIDNSQYFLLLASENAYNARYTPKEIHYAINHKSSDSIIPYIIDNAPIPKVYEFLISDTNYLSIDQCPIETTFIDNLLKKLGRERVDKVTNIEKEITSQQPERKPVEKEKKLVREVNEETEITPQLTDREKYLLSLPDEDIAKFIKKGKYGYRLKSTGEVVIPLKYDYAVSFCEGLAVVQLNGRRGYIDKTGNEVIPLEYDDAWPFCEGKALVNILGVSFYIDKNGNRVEE